MTGTAALTVPLQLHGHVHGGTQPVSGASIQIYAAGAEGLGSSALPLLTEAATTDATGTFSINGSYTCPSPTSALYALAKGGNPRASSGRDNPSITLMTMLGHCNEIATDATFAINEVTTVGAVWPLSAYMTSPTSMGSSTDDATFQRAVADVGNMVDVTNGISPGVSTAEATFGDSPKLLTLANVLASCVNSAGGAAGDNSPCGRLFSLASTNANGPPVDTATAALRIAQNPANNVAELFGLSSSVAPFEPGIVTTPANWLLQISRKVLPPQISLRTGTYVGSQAVAITDASLGNTIHYTTDGSEPSSNSPVYAGPFTVATSSTVRAAAFVGGYESPVTSSALTIADLPATRLAFMVQPSNALVGQGISPTIQVAVEDSNGNLVTSSTTPVTLSLLGGSGLSGALSVVPVNGIATFSDLTISAASSADVLSATDAALSPASSNPFTISAPDLGFSGPIVITQGGTYTGRWQSLDPNVAAVSIQTNDPVIIRDSVIQSRCHMIAGVGGAAGIHLQVTNVVGQALNSGQAGRADGIFLYLENVASLEADHNSMTGVSSGFYIAKSTPGYMRIVNNKATNMDDRSSDGNGGKLATRSTYGHFIMFETVRASAGAEIGWNQVYNTVGQASVEDIISMYSSRGGSTAAPISIHDNFLHGAITNLGLAYTGSGIIMDGDQSSADTESAYVVVNGNQVVQTQNGGIVIPTGHDITVSNNSVVSSGQDGSGNWLAPIDNMGCGYCMTSNQPSQYFNNLFINNYGGLTKLNLASVPTRVDTLLTAASASQNDVATNWNLIGPTSDPNAVTPAAEANEYTFWIYKLGNSGQTVGAAANLQP